MIPGPFVKRFLLQIRDGQLERDSALDLCEENGSDPDSGLVGRKCRETVNPSDESTSALHSNPAAWLRNPAGCRSPAPPRPAELPPAVDADSAANSFACLLRLFRLAVS